tara:strand:+ start:4887 stop:9731 length:4845 start_codon:yes stop_codon:yes gene_type:complete
MAEEFKFDSKLDDVGEIIYDTIEPLTVTADDQNLMRVEANDVGMTENSYAAQALIDALYLQPSYKDHFAVGDKYPNNSREAYDNIKFKNANYVKNRPDIFGKGDYIADKDIINQFSNLQTERTFIEPFARELFKQTGAVTSAVVGTAASYPFISPLFVNAPYLAVPTLLGVGVGTYALGYKTSDLFLDTVAGDDPVVLPSETWKKAAGETFGSLPFVVVPYALPKKINFMANSILKNLYREVELAKPTVATESLANYYSLMEKYKIKPLNKDIWGTAAGGKLDNTAGFGGGSTGLIINKYAEDFVQGISDAYKKYPVPMLAAEGISVTGGALGSAGSEKLFPGNVPMNIGAEIGGSLTFEASLTRMIPALRQVTSVGVESAKTLISDAKNIDKRRLKAVKRIFEILEAEGEDVNSIIKALESNEIKNLIEEARIAALARGDTEAAAELEGFEPTVVNLVESPALTGIFHNINTKSSKNLTKIQSDQQEVAIDGVRSLISAFKLSGNPELYKIAMAEESALLFNLLREDLQSSVLNAIKAHDKVRGKGEGDYIRLGEDLERIILQFVNDTNTVENKLYDLVEQFKFAKDTEFKYFKGGKQVVSKVDGVNVPNFIRVWNNLTKDATPGTLADFNTFGGNVSQDMKLFMKYYFPDADEIIDGENVPASLVKAINQFDDLNTEINKDVFNNVLRAVNLNAKPTKKVIEGLKKDLADNKKQFNDFKKQFKNVTQVEKLILNGIDLQQRLGLNKDKTLKILNVDTLSKANVAPEDRGFIQYFLDLPVSTQRKIASVNLKDLNNIEKNKLIAEIVDEYGKLNSKNIGTTILPTTDEAEPLAEFFRVKSKIEQTGVNIDPNLPPLPVQYLNFLPDNQQIKNRLNKVNKDSSELEKAELVSFIIDEHLAFKGSKGLTAIQKKRLKEAQKLANAKVKKLKEEFRNKEATSSGVKTDSTTIEFTTDTLKQLRTTIRNAKNAAEAAPNGATARGWLSQLSEAIMEDYLSVPGGNANFDTARNFSFVKNEILGRTIIGDLLEMNRKGAVKYDSSVWVRKILAGGKDAVTLRLNQISTIGQLYKKENEGIVIQSRKGNDFKYSAFELLSDEEVKKFDQTNDSLQSTLDQIARNILYKNFDTRNLNQIKEKLDAPDLKKTDQLPIPKSISLEDLQKWKNDNEGVLKLFKLFSDDLNEVETANNLLTSVIQKGSAHNKRILADTFMKNLLDTESLHHAFNAVLRTSKTPTDDFENIFKLIDDLTDEKIINSLKKAGYDANAIDQIKNSPDGLKGHVNDGVKGAILEWAMTSSGGVGSYNAIPMLKLLYEPIPNMAKPGTTSLLTSPMGLNLTAATSQGQKVLLDSARVEKLGGPTLMGIMVKQGFIKSGESRRLKELLERLEVLERAKATNTLTAELIEEQGEFTSVMLSMLGSTAARKVQEVVFGGGGQESLIIAGAGARAAKRVAARLPKTFQLDIMTEIMENPVLFATLLRKVQNENQAVGAANAIEKIMLNAGIIPVRPLPWIIRESFVEGDKPSAVQVAPEDGGVDEDNVTQEDKVSFVQPLPAATQGPPPEVVSPSLASASPIQPITGQGTNQNQRARLAAAFPFDIVSDVDRMKKAGIGSLMG